MSDQPYIDSLVLIPGANYYLDITNGAQWQTINQLALVAKTNRKKLGQLIRTNPYFQDVRQGLYGVLPDTKGGFSSMLYPSETMIKLVTYVAEQNALEVLKRPISAREERRRKANEANKLNEKVIVLTESVPLHLRDAWYDSTSWNIPGYKLSGSVYVAFTQVAHLMDIRKEDVLQHVREITKELHNLYTYDVNDEITYQVFPQELLASVFQYFQEIGNQKAGRYIT